MRLLKWEMECVNLCTAKKIQDVHRGVISMELFYKVPAWKVILMGWR